MSLALLFVLTPAAAAGGIATLIYAAFRPLALGDAV
jgi:hypothetical protein